jgi:RNA polymerase sigma factor (sigma-70 family)
VDDAKEPVTGPPVRPQEESAPTGNLADVSTVEYAMVYQAEKPRLVRYLIHCGASYHDADDAAQRALARLYEKWATVRHPQPWLRKVALRELGRANVTNECLLEGPDQFSAPRDHAGIDCLLEEDTVLSAIRQLPELQRQVFALHFDQFRTSEIAEILQTTEAAVRQNLARARARLKELLGLTQQGFTSDRDSLALGLEGGI